MIKEDILDQCFLFGAFLLFCSNLFSVVEKNLGGPNLIHTENSCFCVVFTLGLYSSCQKLL